MARKKSTEPADEDAPKPKRRRRAAKPKQTETPPPEPDPPVSRGGLLLAVAATAGVWFAPQLVVGQLGRDAAVRACLPAACPPATVGSASVGWLSPVVLRDVVIRDEAGAAVEIGSLKTGRSLVGLATAWCCGGTGFDVGTVVVDRPRVVVDVRAGGSSLEDWFLASEAETPIPSGRVVAREGVVELRAGGETVGEFDGVELDYAWGRGDWRPTALSLRAAAGGEEGGTLGVTYRPEGDDGGMRLVAEAWPLATCDAVAVRTGAAWDLDGTVDADWKLAAAEGLRGAGEVGLSNFVCRGFDGDRRFVVSRATAEGRVDVLDGVLRCESVRAESDFGTATLTAAVPLAALAEGRMAAIAAASGELVADCDLAELSRATRAVGPEATPPLERGRANISVSARHGGGTHRWRGKAAVSDVVTADGRSASPFSLNVDAGYGPGGFDVRTLDCRSSFLTLEGNGTAERASARGRVDLAGLEAELARWVGRKPTGCRGTVDVRMSATTPDGPGERVDLEGLVAAEGLDLRGLGYDLREPRLRANGSATVTLKDGTPETVDRGRLMVEATGDRVDVELLEPCRIEAFRDGPVRAGVTADGDLGRFLARGGRWWRAAMPEMSGQLRGRAEVGLDGEVVSFEKLDATVAEFAGTVGAALIREGRVRLTGGVAVDRDTGGVTAEELLWRSDSLSLRARDAAIAFGEGGPTAKASVAYRGRLDRVSRWFGESQTRPSGIFDGTGEVRAGGGFVNLRATSVVTDPAIGSLWSGAKADIATELRYELGTDRLAVASATVTADTNRAALSGTIENVTTVAVTELKGEATIDPAAFARDSGVTLTGTTTGPLVIRGPLFPPAGATVDPGLVVESSVGWTSGNAAGFPLGPATLPLKLAKGVVTVPETAVAASAGTLKLGGTVDLRGPRTIVRFPAGRVVDRVKVTPAVTASWLSRATPLVAGTSLDGAVSVDVARAALPADRPELIASEATVHLHGLVGTPGGPAAALYSAVDQIERIVDLADGGGNALGIVDAATSLAGNLLGGPGAAGGPVPTMTIPEQSVAVTTRNGVVTHDRMTVRFGESIEVTTSGRVATDGRVDLVAAVPVLDRWVGENGLPESLRGQTLRVPVGGTLENPRVDSRVIAELIRSTGAGRVERELRGRIRDEAGGAVDDAVGELLDRGLRGLFR